jgi:hypothetical protein
MKPVNPAVEREIVTALDLMVKKNGFAAVRRICNRYLKVALARTNARKQIAQLERELVELQAKV